MKKSENVILWIGLSVAMMALMLAGCNPTKKAFDRVQRVENKSALAEICANRFPPKDSIIEKTNVIFDTIYVGSDPVFDTIIYKDTIRITKTLPAQVITKTVEKVKEKWRENTARVDQLQSELTEIKKQLDKVNDDLSKEQQRSKLFKKQRNRSYLWWLILAVAVGGWVYLRKKFSFSKLDKNQIA